MEKEIVCLAITEERSFLFIVQGRCLFFFCTFVVME